MSIKVVTELAPTNRPRSSVSGAAGEGADGFPSLQFSDRLIALGEVMALVGLGHSKIYALIKAGTFPRPVKLGSASRWSEIELRDRINEQLSRRAAA